MDKSYSWSELPVCLIESMGIASLAKSGVWTRAGDGQDLTAMNFEIIAASLLPFNVVCGFCFSMSRVLKSWNVSGGTGVVRKDKPNRTSQRYMVKRDRCIVDAYDEMVNRSWMTSTYQSRRIWYDKAQAEYDP
ncbi:hypothetical protein RRG08_053961 [Elysia crispata]|uniref:Uncharacterized protein n=1 Tax=Elysia crispata TaxID=231223 RepID=A0AAE1DFR7_9GAST|nr:hypothetical protein RRG08_053961 [Elysia crispata]